MSQLDVSRFAKDNEEMLSRILACGDPEAQAYALVLLANAEPDREAIERMQKRLDELKRQATR